jgi:hypothetical protein
MAFDINKSFVTNRWTCRGNTEPILARIQDMPIPEGSTTEVAQSERTCTKVEMGEICGAPESGHYSLTHPFEHAGVAQSAEQDFRKVEAEGSTPFSSSTTTCPRAYCKSGHPLLFVPATRGFNETYTHMYSKDIGWGCSIEPVVCSKGHHLKPSTVNESGWTHMNGESFCSPTPDTVPESRGFSENQRALMGTIVSHRVAYEDNRKLVREAQHSLADADEAHRKVQVVHQSRITLCNQQSQYHLEQMQIAEDELRASIQNDLLIKGPSKPEEVPEAASVEPDGDLGRAE